MGCCMCPASAGQGAEMAVASEHLCLLCLLLPSLHAFLHYLSLLGFSAPRDVFCFVSLLFLLYGGHFYVCSQGGGFASHRDLWLKMWIRIHLWFSKPLPCYLAMISLSPIEAFFWCHRGLAGSWCKGIAHLHNLISGIVEKHTLEAAELIDWSDDDTDMSGISAAFLHHWWDRQKITGRFELDWHKNHQEVLCSTADFKETLQPQFG